ncbi:MAG: hypothetical protein JNL75_03265 [Chitinophagales bacterium]|nr:hypothetical protein [Chitinophagales bacterium]
MKFNFKIFFVIMAMLLFRGIVFAQIPVEVFVGHKKATADIMFFKFLKNKERNNSKFLFFNRNRASIDYAMTKTTNLPQFGFTEAISYNHENLKGFAPVIVASILNKGVYPKAGIQFAKIKKEYTIFSWLVTETLKEPNIDFFFLARYTPKLTEKLNLFSQVELVNAFPTVAQNTFSFTQRFRLGLKVKEFQFGAGLDLSQLGREDFITTENFGGFLRYEF